MASAQEQDTLPKSDLERCLELLKAGTSDESKFVGLTLMTTFLQTKQQDKDREPIITQFFNSMDFDFLDRMLQIGMVMDFRFVSGRDACTQTPQATDWLPSGLAVVLISDTRRLNSTQGCRSRCTDHQSDRRRHYDLLLVCLAAACSEGV